MKLYIKEKVISIHNKFYIQDENHNNIYEVSNKVVTIGRKTTIKDMAEKELVYIEREPFKLVEDYYHIFINNEEIQLIKKFKILATKYQLSNGYSVEGDALKLNFTIYDENKNEIASIKKNFISLPDKYEINIHTEKDFVLILAILAIIVNDVDDSQSD